jgi:hypothetical protein
MKNIKEFIIDTHFNVIVLFTLMIAISIGLAFFGEISHYTSETIIDLLRVIGGFVLAIYLLIFAFLISKEVDSKKTNKDDDC